MTIDDYGPNGCYYCGHNERNHYGFWHPVAKWHHYVPPTIEQIKQRMINRRGERSANRLTPRKLP